MPGKCFQTHIVFKSIHLGHSTKPVLGFVPLTKAYKEFVRLLFLLHQRLPYQRLRRAHSFNTCILMFSHQCLDYGGYDPHYFYSILFVSSCSYLTTDERMTADDSRRKDTILCKCK